MSERSGAAEPQPQPLADDAAHLLLVDDDRRIRDLLSRFLQRNGYRVTLAATAAEAQVHLRSFAFDLLVLDVMMPGQSGLSLAETVRQTSEVPILMLTALADADDRVRGLEVGADDYLTKPFDVDEPLQVVAVRVIGTRIRFEPHEVVPAFAAGVSITDHIARSLAAAEAEHRQACALRGTGRGVAALGRSAGRPCPSPTGGGPSRRRGSTRSSTPTAAATSTFFFLLFWRPT